MRQRHRQGCTQGNGQAAGQGAEQHCLQESSPDPFPAGLQGQEKAGDTHCKGRNQRQVNRMEGIGSRQEQRQDAEKKKEKRLEYIQSLSQSQDLEDSSVFIDFMLNHHIENLKQQIIEYKNSMEADLLEGGQKLKGGQKEWSETTQKVFDIIKSNPLVTRQQLCDELKINPSAIQKHIEKLKAQNVIKRQGGAKGGHWEILK